MRIVKSCLLLACLYVAAAQAVVLPLDTRFQEKANWSWAGVAQSALAYHGIYVSQTELASWATPGYANAAIPLNGSQGVIHGLNEVFAHYGLSTQYYDRALTLSELNTALGAGQLVIAQESANMELLFGTTGSFVQYMVPWPGMGVTMASYSVLVDNTAESYWNYSLVVTSARGTLPARPIPESKVPRDVALYGFDYLRLNDRAVCYRSPSTSSEYGAVGSGYAYGLYTYNDAYGLVLGAAAKTGIASSSGPVELRSYARVNGSLTMKDLGGLTRQSGAVVSGSLVQAEVPYNGFGWGRLLVGASVANVTIEPDQPASTLAPGVYRDYTIQARSPIKLSAGDYYFRDLVCNSCTLSVDASAGPVRVYVDHGLVWTGSLGYTQGGPARFMLGYLGEGTVYLNGKLDGTVLAPNAELVLGQTVKEYTGSYMARRLVLHQDAIVRYQAFSFE